MMLVVVSTLSSRFLGDEIRKIGGTSDHCHYKDDNMPGEISGVMVEIISDAKEQ